MEQAQAVNKSLNKIPNGMILGVLLICTLPLVLNLFGVDFGTAKHMGNTAHESPVDAMFYKLSGAFSHTLLEWSAFCTAIFTVILALVHFRIQRDVTTPIIGMALFLPAVWMRFIRWPRTV